MFPLGLTLAVAAVDRASTVFAQAASPQDKAAAIKQSLAENQAQLRQYTWIETTEISLKGEVKKKWGQITDNDLLEIEGVDRLVHHDHA